MSEFTIVLSVEQGVLEKQAILLVESIRTFAGKFSDNPIWAISPRPSMAMSEKTRGILETLGVTVLTMPLLSPTEEYGSIARLAACAWAEEHIHSRFLVSLDNDVFFACEPTFRMDGCDFLARPVDVKGMCTSGPGDPNDAFWRKACEICGVDYERIPMVTTTLDRVSVKASYNGGLMVTDPKLKIFRRAHVMYDQLRAHGTAPRPATCQQVYASTGYVSNVASQWFGTAQVVLSLAIAQAHARVMLAPEVYNVPVHLKQNAGPPGTEVPLSSAVLIHYHWMLYEKHLDPDEIIRRGAPLRPAVREWLRQRVPIG